MTCNVDQTFELVLYAGMALIVCPIISPHVEFGVISIQPIVTIWLRAEPILLALNQEPEVARLAGIYLRWASLGLPAYTFNCISRYTVSAALAQKAD
jgi:hypothetical protein